MATKPALNAYEGRDVLQATIRVTNAGDGLSTALGIDPVEYRIGQTVYVVLECEVARVQFDELKDTDCLVRVHTLRAGTGTIVDAELVADVLSTQKEKNRKARDEADGVHELEFGDGDQPDGEPAEGGDE